MWRSLNRTIGSFQVSLHPGSTVNYPKQALIVNLGT